MKKLLFLLPISLFANNIYYDIASSYKNNDFKTAYELSNKVCQNSCSDINLNLILGKSAFKLGKYDEALAAFDRVLVFDDSNVDARLQSAIIYQKNGNYELLKIELDSLQNDPKLNDEERRIVSNMLRGLKKQEQHKIKANSPYASVSIGYGYDSNPKKQNLKDSYLPIPQLGINFPISGAMHEPASSVIANANMGYKKQVNDIYDFDIGINFYNKYYIKEIEDNFQNLSVFTTSINNGFEISRQFKMNILLSYDYIILKQKRYLNTLTADVSGDYYFENGVSLGLGYTINHNNYINPENKENDSDHHSIYAMGKLISQRSMMYLKMAYDIEKNSKVDDSTNDYKEYSATVGFIYLLNKQVMLKASIGYARSKYDEKIFNNSRQDTSIRFSVGAEYNMDHHNIFSVDLGYDRLKSTIEYNSYDNYFANLLYKYKF